MRTSGLPKQELAAVVYDLWKRVYCSKPISVPSSVSAISLGNILAVMSGDDDRFSEHGD